MTKILWFRAKRYGYGWTPCSWEGWLVLLAFMAALVAGAYVVDSFSSSSTDSVVKYIGLVILLSALLFYICIKKGEPARWQWGGEKK